MHDDEIPESILQAQRDLETRRAEHRASDPAMVSIADDLGAPMTRDQFVAHWTAVGKTLPLLTEDEVRKLDESRDFGLWPDRLRSSGIIPELHDDDIPRLERDECLPTRPLAIVKRWVAAHRRPSVARPPPSWLFMCGGRGVGKTVAAGWTIAQIGGAYTTMLGLLEEYQARSKRQNRDGDDPFPRRLERAGLVVLDELGAERDEHAALAREVVFRLVSRRQSRRRMTLVLTNDDVAACRQRFASGVYDERAHDRLQPMAAWVECAGESMRRARGEDAP